MQPSWSPHGLDHFISLPLNFLTSNSGFCILSALVRSRSFVKLFAAELRHKNLKMVFSLFMFVDLQTTFAMLSLCYAQCPGYLLHTMFPSPSIL
jgi:hypothetical protein